MEWKQHPAEQEPWYERGGQLYVRGTMDLWPVIGPVTVHGALLNDNPCFDAIRRSLVEHRGSDLRAFSRALHDVRSTPAHPEWSRDPRVQELVDAVRRVVGDSQGDIEAPPDFMERLWPCYMQALQLGCPGRTYWLSCDELLVLAHLADVNLVIVKQEFDVFEFVESNIADASQRIVVSSIRANGAAEVNSHFERLIIEEEYIIVQDVEIEMQRVQQSMERERTSMEYEDAQAQQVMDAEKKAVEEKRRNAWRRREDEQARKSQEDEWSRQMREQEESRRMARDSGDEEDWKQNDEDRWAWQSSIRVEGAMNDMETTDGRPTEGNRSQGVPPSKQEDHAEDEDVKTQLDQDRAAEVARIAAECHAMAAGGQSLGSASSNTEASDDSLDGSDAEAEEERRDACYLRVRASPSVLNNAETEEDIIRQRCQELRGYFRDRPDLPPDPWDGEKSYRHVDTGVSFPRFSCPF